MMSRKIILKNEQVSQFLRTDDAIKALQTSVDNGQIRLALQILVEIVNDLNSNINVIEEKSEDKIKPTKVIQDVKTPVEKVQTKQKIEQSASDSEENA